MVRILIGETQQDLATAMNDWFSRDYTVAAENNGWQILECLCSKQYDAIICETVMPGLDGLSLVRRFRTSGGTTPIILLASNHSSEEMQEALDAGADVYLVKPFRLADLSAIVRAVLRRPEMRNQKLLKWGGLSMDIESGIVSINGLPVHFHPMEYKLLQFFLTHLNQVFSAEALSERVWQKEPVHGNETVRTHIRTLRQKLDANGSPSMISTLRGLGYKISEGPLPATAIRMPLRVAATSAIAS